MGSLVTSGAASPLLKGYSPFLSFDTFQFNRTERNVVYNANLTSAPYSGIFLEKLLWISWPMKKSRRFLNLKLGKRTTTRIKLLGVRAKNLRLKGRIAK
jgi:hypothetical protein